jgi:hypothetical protein
MHEQNGNNDRERSAWMGIMFTPDLVFKKVMIGAMIAVAFVGISSLQSCRNQYVELYYDRFGLDSKSTISDYRLGSWSARLHWLNRMCNNGVCLDPIDWKCGFSFDEGGILDGVNSCFIANVMNAPLADTLGKLRLLCGRKYMVFTGTLNASQDECAKAGGQWGVRARMFSDELNYIK